MNPCTCGHHDVIHEGVGIGKTAVLGRCMAPGCGCPAFLERPDGAVDHVHHTYKIWPQFFGALGPGGKTFEIRKADRPVNPKVGDVLHLREWDPEREDFTGREKSAEVIYVLRIEDVPGIAAEDWVVYGLGNWVKP